MGFQGVEPDKRQDNRGSYTDRILAQCERELERLKQTDSEASIIVWDSMDHFVKRWREGALAEELAKSRLKYKQLQGTECRRLRVKQIYAGRHHRVALVITECPPEIVFVAIYAKTDQERGIKRAVRRARDFLEGGGPA